MEIPLRLWAVYCRALIVLIIRKFLFPSRQNLPCCSLSPLFLVLSAADVKNRLFVPSADALSVFEDFHYVLPWPPCAQTRGSRYRQPVLRDGLSSDSGVRQSSRAGMRFSWCWPLFGCPVGGLGGLVRWCLRAAQVGSAHCRAAPCGAGLCRKMCPIHPSIRAQAAGTETCPVQGCPHGDEPLWVCSEVAPGRGERGEESRGQPGDCRSPAATTLIPRSPGTCQPRRSVPQHYLSLRSASGSRRGLFSV